MILFICIYIIYMYIVYVCIASLKKAKSDAKRSIRFIFLFFFIKDPLSHTQHNILSQHLPSTIGLKVSKLNFQDSFPLLDWLLRGISMGSGKKKRNKSFGFCPTATTDRLMDISRWQIHGCISSFQFSS